VVRIHPPQLIGVSRRVLRDAILSAGSGSSVLDVGAVRGPADVQELP